MALLAILYGVASLMIVVWIGFTIGWAKGRQHERKHWRNYITGVKMPDVR